MTTITDGQRLEVKGTIIPSVKYGLPITADQDKWIALCKILTDILRKDGKVSNPISFTSESPGPPIAGLATVEEGRFADGKWARGRTLAGDDTGQGNRISLDAAREPGILRVTLYRYR